MEHSKHIWRAALILLFLLVGIVTARQFLIPPSFGVTGPFRQDSIGEFMDQPLMHGGRKSCQKCHEKEQGAVEKGKHKAVSCEVCHAPLAVHAREGAKKEEGKIADMPRSPSYRLCAQCHQKLRARPETFPQVELRKHLEEQEVPVGAKIPERLCLKCHDAHDPSNK